MFDMLMRYSFGDIPTTYLLIMNIQHFIFAKYARLTTHFWLYFGVIIQ